MRQVRVRQQAQPFVFQCLCISQKMQVENQNLAVAESNRGSAQCSHAWRVSPSFASNAKLVAIGPFAIAFPIAHFGSSLYLHVQVL